MLLPIFLVITFIIGPALYVGMKREQKKIAEIDSHDLKVYRIHGTLTRQVVGGVIGPGTGITTYKVGDFMLPEVAGPVSDRFLYPYVGKPVTAEYIPSISRNRSIIDSQGNGYNFISAQPVS